MDHPVEVARAPVRGAFLVPPSKTYHQRALVLAALADGPSRIETGGQEPGDDVRRLAAALERMGPWTPEGLGRSRDRIVVDLGRGATGFRFAVAVAALRRPGARTLVRGHPALLARPHRPLLRALERLGAHVRRRPSGAVRVLGGRLRGGRIALPATGSSQYASALLLVAPRVGGLEITLVGRPVSTPYLLATVEVLRAFGVTAEAQGLEGPDGTLRVGGGPVHGTRYEVPPDASAATAWWAAAALTAGEAWVDGLGRGSAQADAHLLGVLERMGARIVDQGGAAHVHGPATLRAPGDVDLRDAPDLLPIVGALAGATAGRTTVRGVAHARRKESDRVATVAAALRALGAQVEEREDGLEIEGGGLRGGAVDVAGDHRIAFAFGVIGLRVPGVVLRGAEAVVKSHPRFLEDLARAARRAPAPA